MHLVSFFLNLLKFRLINYRLRLATFSNLSNPNELGLNQTYPFRLSLNDHIHLGAWFKNFYLLSKII